MKTMEEVLASRKRGYNCAQAVACAYAQEAGEAEQLLFRLTEGFGGGMGTHENVCGALAGAVLLAGLANSTGNLEKPDSKEKTRRVARALVEGFQERAGAVNCSELKGIHTGKMLCSCDDCVKIACALTEEVVYKK